jgi:hypothetical protein
MITRPYNHFEHQENVVEYLDSIQKIFDTIVKLSSYDSTFEGLKTIKRIVDSWYDRLPVKEEDRVMLMYDYENKLPKSSGWYSSRRTLRLRALGTIKSIYISDSGSINASVTFDEEYWTDDKGIEHPTSRSSVFYIPIERLQKLEEHQQDESKKEKSFDPGGTYVVPNSCL